MLKLAGNNKFYQINDDQSKKNSQNESVISPIYTSPIKISNLLSYSICYDHAVYITKDGLIKGVGDNSKHQIWDSLPREIIKQWTEFELQDVYGAKYIPLSAVCGRDYTLYMAQKQEDSKEIQLIYACPGKNYGLPIFLSTNGLKPKSIYGGLTVAASIDENGLIVIINDLIFANQNYTPLTGKLPENEIPISIVCCESKYFVLSSNGRLFESEKPFGNEYTFTEVEELQKVKIINISGLNNQCLAVSQSGEVYGIGDSSFLGFGDDNKTIEKFTKNKNLKKYVIKAAFAGTDHSLFLTVDGKVLSCGSEDSGSLLIEGELKNAVIHSPTETIVKENASFCIAGVGISAVFVGSEVPKNCPNKPTQEMNVVVDSSQSRCCLLI